MQSSLSFASETDSKRFGGKFLQRVGNGIGRAIVRAAPVLNAVAPVVPALQPVAKIVNTGLEIRGALKGQ
jgi:hypothetical protein